MLYVSTRNKVDAFTTYRALRSETAPDGGYFVPMQLPILTDVQFAQLEQMNFGQATAFAMNLLFGTQITGWDVDFAVGRQAVVFNEIGPKVFVSENWHNPAGEFAYFVRRLYALVHGEKFPNEKPNAWFLTAAYIAVLFGAYGQLCRRDVYEFDIAVQTLDLQQMLAIRCAQKMGLPIMKIVLGSLDGDGLWEFFSYGDFATARDVLPTGLESLLWLQLGVHEVQKFLTISQKRGIYKLKLTDLDVLKQGVFVAVVGNSRAKDVAHGAIRSVGYAMEAGTARAFGALQDYRAKHGESRNTLLLADVMPGNLKTKNISGYKQQKE